MEPFVTHGISWLESTGVLVREVTFCFEAESQHSLAQTVHLSQLIYNQLNMVYQALDTTASVPALGLDSLPCCPLLTCRPLDSALPAIVQTCY